jgi:hypothetical protein
VTNEAADVAVGADPAVETRFSVSSLAAGSEREGGDVGCFVGHNAFIRWSALQEIAQWKEEEKRWQIRLVQREKGL